LLFLLFIWIFNFFIGFVMCNNFRFRNFFKQIITFYWLWLIFIKKFLTFNLILFFVIFILLIFPPVWIILFLINLNLIIILIFFTATFLRFGFFLHAFFLIILTLMRMILTLWFIILILILGILVATFEWGYLLLFLIYLITF